MSRSMPRRRSRRAQAAAWSAGLLGVASVTALGVAPAQAAVPPGPSYTHCTTVLARIRPDSPATRVVSRSCTTSRAQAADLAPSPLVVAATVYTPLLVQYENLNYGGSSNVLYGTSGPCDLTGYSINRNTWGTRTSSIKWASNCTMIDAFHDSYQSGFCVHFYGNVGYVGSRLNDHVYSYHVSSGSDYCNR